MNDDTAQMNTDLPYPAPAEEGHGAAMTGEGPEYRTPPHNLQAEQELLGAILVNNDAAARVEDFLRPEHFIEGVHQKIYAAAMRLIDKGELATPVTLRAYLERDESFADIGGDRYLAELAAAATTVINAEEYGRIIYDAAMRRELISLGTEIVNRGYDAPPEEDHSQQIEQAEGALFKLAETGARESNLVTFHSALSESLRAIDAAYKRDGRLVGVTTGLRDLDKALGGMHPSDLLILAGRPSMGKTALATTLAFNAAKAYRKITDSSGRHTATEGAVVAFFSLEMSADQLSTRLLAEEARIPSEKLRKGEVSADDFANVIMPAVQRIENTPLYIDDTPAITISTLRTRARRLKRTHDLGLIVVDYLQLMRPSGYQRTENRVQEISEITRGLKAIAKELSVPVLALSQLSRAVEQREDKRPQLSDLRESGSIEQDADVVMFVYREEYYLSRTEPEHGTEEWEEWKEKMERVHSIAEVIIGKQRHGPIGTVRLMFEPRFTAFRNLEQPDRYDQ